MDQDKNKFKLPKFDSPKNYKEDYTKDNGYICKCYTCREHFYGHKRRTICKECITEQELNGNGLI